MAVIRAFDDKSLFNYTTMLTRGTGRLIQVAAQYRITRNAHWAWSYVNFNGVSYKNISYKKTIQQSTLFQAINT